MTSGSSLRLFLQLFAAVVSVSAQQVSLPNNILQFKTPHEQYQFRHGYQFSIPGGTQHHDSTKMNVLPYNQPVPHHDYTQRTRSPIHPDEFPTPVQPESIPTPNHQPAYYPLHFGQQKDLNAENSGLQNKLLGLANALARSPKPDVRSFDQVTSSSEVHPEICAPPKPPLPQPTPCTSQPQPTACSPQSQTTPCASQPQLAPQSSSCLQPPPAPCSTTKAEVVTPAPKFIPAKNPFLSEQISPDLSKSSVVRVSSLHSSAKFSEEGSEAPCAPSPPAPPSKKECEPEQEKKGVFPVIIPAERPIVCNPFSDSQRERVIPLPNPKGILHHRLHADEHLEYPEGYISRPEAHVKPVHVPYVVTYPGQYQTAGMGKHVGYAYVPVPPVKPIPLVVPPEKEAEGDCEDENDVVYHQGRSSRRYDDDKDWSRQVLRDIADKLGAILDEESFRSSRRSSRPDRGYGDERYEDQGYSSRNYARSNGDYYEQDYDDDRWKERKYSRGSSY